MKKMTLLLSVLVATSLTACTQYKSVKHEKQKQFLIEDTINTTNPNDRALFITEKMIEVLSLTEVQEKKVALINFDFSSRYNFLAASKNPKINKRNEFIKLTKEKDLELQKVLNNAQITKWHAVSNEFWEEYRIL